jgi:hypothetical protein
MGLWTVGPPPVDQDVWVAVSRSPQDQRRGDTISSTASLTAH